MRGWRPVLWLAAAGVVVFLGWRMVRPMNIYVVTEAFERPVDTSAAPAALGDLGAEGCGECHRTFYDEWRTTIHSRAWTDPYFQADWAFDGRPQNCKNCHIPLDRQQEHRVLGFNDADRWDPILAPNPDFDPALQHEGVTCAACHLREGRIQGVLGTVSDAHPVERLASGNEICVRCHLVSGERWDTFFRFPPCGTVAEIRAGAGGPRAPGGEAVMGDPATLGCVDCHMPLEERPLVPGGEVRPARRHLWRGGHDPEMVKRALAVDFGQVSDDRYRLTLTNVGAAHYVPTGTPDRHFTLTVRLLDGAGRVVAEEGRILKRRVMWRPFIVDLWDDRLPPGEPRHFDFDFPAAALAQARTVEATVRYGLVEESRLRRIGHRSEVPLSYTVYQRSLGRSPG